MTSIYFFPGEWISGAVCMYIVDNLITNYEGTDDVAEEVCDLSWLFCIFCTSVVKLSVCVLLSLTQTFDFATLFLYRSGTF